MPKRVKPVRAPSTAELRADFWRAPVEALLDRKTAAAGMGYTVGWLEWAATHGGGPILTKIGRNVRYCKSEDERVHGQRFATRTEMTAMAFDYIEALYNRRRLHSTLGYKAPAPFLQECLASQRVEKQIT